MIPQDEKEKELRELTGLVEADQPSMRFTKNVMDAIEGMQIAPVSKHYVNEWIVKGVAAVLIGAVLVLTGYAYIHADAISSFTLPIKTAFSFSDKAVFYIIGANIVLLLALADLWLGRCKRINEMQRK